MVFSVVTPPIIAVMCSLQAYLDPCLPLSLGYTLLPQCHEVDWYMTNTVVKGIIVIETGVLSLFLFVYESLLLSTLTSLHIFCLIEYLHLVQEKFSKLTQFGNKAHRYFAIQRVFKMYKEIELLVANYNFIHKGLLTCSEKVLILLCLVVSLYIFVTSYSLIAVPLLLIVTSTIKNCLLIIIERDGKLKTKLYLASEATMTKVKNSDIMCVSYLRKKVKAMRNLRVYFTSNTFYSRTTPLEILNISINLTIDLLLL